MIIIENLSKKFGKFEVLKSVSCEFKTGSVTALIGPNSSGKTTLIKCILGLVKADTGNIYMAGKEILQDWHYRKQIGYMPQSAKYPENLTVGEVFGLLRNLRPDVNLYDMELYNSYELGQQEKKKINTLSGGAKQKLSAALTLLFKPNLVIFDEPTAGLDPRSSHKFKEKVSALKEQGKTVVITSHIMSELEDLADEVVFLLDGQVHFIGSLQKIMDNSQETRLERAVASMMEKINL